MNKPTISALGPYKGIALGSFKGVKVNGVTLNGTYMLHIEAREVTYMIDEAISENGDFLDVEDFDRLIPEPSEEIEAACIRASYAEAQAALENMQFMAMLQVAFSSPYGEGGGQDVQA